MRILGILRPLARRLDCRPRCLPQPTSPKTDEARRLIVNLRASVILKEGGFLLSRIVLQYHRRHWA